jgi:histidine triad (HIT) family protein
LAGEKGSKVLFSLSKSALGGLIVGLAFGKFSGLLPIKRVKETDKVVAFWHPRPSWEKHILIVPKKPIKNLPALIEADYGYVDEVYRVANAIVQELGGWEKEGYSIICNGGSRQEVHQLHFHLVSGALLDTPKTDELSQP